MNIVDINGVKRFVGFNNRVEIKTDFNFNDKNNTMVILSEDDMQNDNSVIKLRGKAISCLFLPKKYKYTFNEQKTFLLIEPCLTKNSVISFY